MKELGERTWGGRASREEQLHQELWGRTVLRMLKEQQGRGCGRSRVSVESVSVSCGYCNTLPQTGSLKQQKLTLSPFCKSEVQNQGLARAALPLLRFWGRTCSLPLPASGGCQPSLICDHTSLTSISLVTLMLLLCVIPSPASLSQGHLLVDLQSTTNDPTSRFLILSAKTLFQVR